MWFWLFQKHHKWKEKIASTRLKCLVQKTWQQKTILNCVGGTVHVGSWFFLWVSYVMVKWPGELRTCFSCPEEHLCFQGKRTWPCCLLFPSHLFLLTPCISTNHKRLRWRTDEPSEGIWWRFSWHLQVMMEVILCYSFTQLKTAPSQMRKFYVFLGCNLDWRKQNNFFMCLCEVFLLKSCWFSGQQRQKAWGWQRVQDRERTPIVFAVFAGEGQKEGNFDTRGGTEEQQSWFWSTCSGIGKTKPCSDWNTLLSSNMQRQWTMTMHSDTFCSSCTRDRLVPCLFGDFLFLCNKKTFFLVKPFAHTNTATL